MGVDSCGGREGRLTNRGSVRRLWENASGPRPRGPGAKQASDETRYRSLFEAAFHPIVVLDQSTLVVVDANGAAAELLGYSREDLLGLCVKDICADITIPGESAASGPAREPRFRMRRGDGSLLLVEVGYVHSRLGERDEHALFLRDVSEEVVQERTQATAELKFAAAFASSSDAINITRLEDGIFVEVNEGFTRLTGFTAEETVGRSSLELEVWADPADRDRMIGELLEEGCVSELETCFRSKDGGIRVGSFSARIIQLGGRPHVLSVTRDITDRKRAEEALERSNVQLSKMVQDMTAAMGRVVETRDPYTHGHQERVARLARAIAVEMGLSHDDIEGVGMAALVHDVGKLSVPAEILNKPGGLSSVEFGLIKSHSVRGHAILGDVDFPWPLASIVLQHHERMDGSGYPEGLVGDEILLAARILAIADVVEAMASHRPYRPALGLEAAVEEIRLRPERYDSDAREACLRLYVRGELDFLCQERSDE